MNAIYEDAWLVARAENFMSRLVTNFTGTNEAMTRSSSTYGEATMVAVGETDDLSSQTFTPSVTSTLTPAEAGAQFFLTDMRIASDPFGVRNDAAMELGQATAKKMNDDILGLFDNVTGGTIGGAGTTITWGHFFAAVATLRGQKAPPPYVAVVHSYQWHRLAKAASVATSNASAPGMTDEISRRWFVNTVAGVDIYETPDIAVDSSDDGFGCVFSPLAFALDMRRAPRLEPERDASRRGWELNMTTVYASGVWRPTWAVALQFDAAAPTS
jgi:hypothetical protein